MKSTQSLVPVSGSDEARLAQTAAGESGNSEDASRSLAYEVENGAAPKESRLRKKLDKQARLQPSADAQATELAAADASDGGAMPTEMADGDAPDLPLTAMLPEPRPGAALAAPLVARTEAASVQVASLDPSIGVSQDRFGGADPLVPMAGAAGARLASLSAQADESAPPQAPQGRVGPAAVAARSSELDQLIAHYAGYYGVPEALVRRVAKRESTFNPRATNGPYLGLMQISLPTARGMGYRGDRGGLLDAETNLKYAVRYLRGAYLVARGDHDKADRLYQTGYYYHAKRAGLLDETGVGRDRRRLRPL